MGTLFKNTGFNFFVDVVVCSLASLSSILFARLYVEAIPGYINTVLVWVSYAIVASVVSVLISKTHRVMFAMASFKSLAYLLECAAIKVVVMALPLVLTGWLSVPNNTLLLFADFTFTMIFLVALKLLNKYYVSEYQETNETKAERAVDCLNVLVYGLSQKSTAAAIRYTGSKTYNVVGFITRDPQMDGKIVMEKPVHLYKDNKQFNFRGAEAVLFTRKDDWDNEADSLIKNCFDKGICVLSIPTVENTNYSGMQVHEIKHVLENQFIPDRMTAVGRALKRLIDLALSTIAIILFSPAMAIIAIVIRVNDGKPVLFRQERIGRFGRPFTILKFRTMRLDAEAAGPALYSGDDDPRLTKVGKFLRTHHLDEMPQLFNIWIGDMSFVGYRPERKVFINEIVERDPRYSYLFQIRPGVTSYATLRNGYADSMEKMLRRLNLDLYYLNHRSLLMEFKIILDTFINISSGKKF